MRLDIIGRRDKIFWTLRMKRIEFFVRRLFVIILISVLLFGLGAIAQSVDVIGLYIATIFTIISLIYIILIGRGIKKEKKDEWFTKLLGHDLLPFTIFTYSYLYFTGYMSTLMFNDEVELLLDVKVPLFIWMMFIFVAFYMIVIQRYFDPLFKLKSVVHYVKIGSIEYTIDGTLSNGMIVVSEGKEDEFIPMKEEFFYKKRIRTKKAVRYWERS